MGPRRIVAATITVAVLSIGLAGSPALAETIGGEKLGQSGRIADLGPRAHALPEIWAESWIIADATSGEVLAAKSPHLKRAPASTLKTLTALTVLPRTNPQEVWTASPLAAYQDGSRVGLKPGKKYTLDELWYAVFLPSANDAAVAVAQANGGVKKTVRQMNDRALELQALDTVAKTPNGLDRPGQVTSAYDLALFGRAGMQREDFAHYAGTERAMFPDVKGKGKHPIYTTNRLLLSDFRGVTGVKTGFTTQAGRTYIGAATRGGTSLVVALMGIHESTEDAARKLLRWGFHNHDKVTPVGMLVDPIVKEAAPATQPREDATEAATASASPSAATDPTALAPSGSSSAITYAGAFLIIAALAGAAFAVTRKRLGRYRGRHSQS